MSQLPGRRVSTPQFTTTGEMDCQVVTVLISTAEPGDLAVPAIFVNVNPIPYRTGAFGQQIDLLAQRLHRDLGMQPLGNFAEAITRYLPDWTVSLRPGRPDQPGIGNVFSADGELFASNVTPFPLWEKAIADFGDRTIVYYAPGVHIPGGQPSDVAEIDMRQVAACADHGWLMGGCVPVRWRDY